MIAIELLAACQAIEFLRPLTTTQPLEEVISVVRSQVPAWTKDRFMAPDIEKAVNMLKEGKIWAAVKDLIEDDDESVSSPKIFAIDMVGGAQGFVVFM